MIRTTEREARKRHVCGSCTTLIEPGDYYLELAASPFHDDLSNPTWWRLVECRDCAEHRGRSALFQRALSAATDPGPDADLRPEATP